ncbi:hypothetical protein CVU75_00160 [Candidatus Dependentiae bacterium HGW-Dependentiae-1]|nr:MAG: hypothetical protein CVU75_00160 [Candidatus Dependentiae bacterium HGW-Dependentiae-1]
MKKIFAIAVLLMSSVALMNAQAKIKGAGFDSNFDKGDSRYSCEHNCQRHNTWSGWFKTGKWSKACVDTCKRAYEKRDKNTQSIKHEKATKNMMEKTTME